MPEQIKELPFPLQGIDVSNALSSQRAGTTNSGVNVRGFEPSTDRQRGGARPGLSPLFEQIPEGARLIQHLNTVDPTQEAGLLDDTFAWPRAALPVGGPFPIQGDNPLDTPAPDGFDLDRSTTGPPSSWGTVTTSGSDPVFSRNPGRIVREGGSGVWPNKNTRRVGRKVPLIVWAIPAAIVDGTALSVTQLNAVAKDPDTLVVLSGVYVYTPTFGRVLPLGTNPLYVLFSPANSTLYTKNSKSNSIMVVDATATMGLEIQVLSAGAYADPFFESVEVWLNGVFMVSMGVDPLSAGLDIVPNVQLENHDFGNSTIYSYISTSFPSLVNPGSNFVEIRKLDVNPTITSSASVKLWSKLGASPWSLVGVIGSGTPSCNFTL